MPKFKVTKCVDAYAHYSTVVEAPSADAAIIVAQQRNAELPWDDDGISFYDDVSWDNIEPELVSA